MVFNALRFTVSVLVMGAVFGVEVAKRTDVPAAKWTFWSSFGLKIALLGFLGHVIYQILFVVGVDNTSAGNASLLISSAPIWVAVVAHLTGIERVIGRAWMGLLLAFVGAATIIIFTSGVDLGGTSLYGNLVCLAGAVTWGAYTAFNKPLMETLSPTALAFWTSIIGLPFLWLFSIPYWGDVSVSVFSWGVWGAILFSGGLSSGLAYVFWNIGIQGVGAAQTAIYANFVPVVALISGVFMLGESVIWQQLVGGALILGGIYVMRTARKAEAVEAEV